MGVSFPAEQCVKTAYKATNKSTRANVGLLSIRRGRRRLDIDSSSTAVWKGTN